jgi:hypothetical protein
MLCGEGRRWLGEGGDGDVSVVYGLESVGRAVIAVCEGRDDRARWLATRWMSTIQHVPKGVGVWVPVC